jgi:hypothetical protein
MKYFLQLVIGCTLVIPCYIFGQYTDEINSNRPGVTMTAFAVGKTVFQAESGIYMIKSKHETQNYTSSGLGFDVMLRFGMFSEKLELIADIQNQSEKEVYETFSIEKSGLKKTVLGAKYLIYDPFKFYEKKVNLMSWNANQKFDWHQMIPAVSVFVGANLTFSNNSYYYKPSAEVSPKVTLITQNHFGDKRWVFVTNTTADFITTQVPSYDYALTLTRGFSPKFSAFVENQGYFSDYYSDLIFRGGGAFLVNSDFQVDISISKSLKTTPDILYGGIGFSWRYDDNYKEIKVSKESIKNKQQAKALKRVKKTKKG